MQVKEIHLSTFEQYEPSYCLCPNCNKKISLYCNFCPFCGIELSFREETAQNKN